MPWCPNCKTEYREGITHCADCKVELVAEYKDAVLQDATEMIVKVDGDHQMFIEKLRDFLEYSDISSVIHKDEDMIGLYVAPQDFKKAKKCFKAFYSVETEMMMQQAAEATFLKGEEYDYFGDDEEDEEESENDSPSAKYTTYYDSPEADSEESESKKHVSAVARYEDYRSSGVTFTVLGVLGLVFALLNFMDVISLFGSGFSCFVLFVLFGIFLALGLYSFAKAEKLKESADAENKTVAEAKEWMKENISKEMIEQLNSDETDEEGQKSAELLYLDRLDQLADKLLDAFPTLNASLAEQLIEEFSNQNNE